MYSQRNIINYQCARKALGEAQNLIVPTAKTLTSDFSLQSCEVIIPSRDGTEFMVVLWP